ncbi:MAG: alpha/beta fold hydrolase [Chitinophagales bacterium]|nr:alpha/beta fold hydrolase [Chitinophagales bacterium]MDW8394131.1 alpha/beta fold hydrolase [Chitinophagales bacterium]
MLHNDKFINHKGAVIHYVVAGLGSPVILVHGFCEDHSVWLKWAAPLAEHRKLILPDLPGFGRSQLPGSSMQMSDYAEAVRAVAEAEGVASAPFLGHSMGGYTVLQLAQQHPERVNGLGLFHSSALEDDEQKKTDRQRVADFVRQNGKEPFVAELIPKLFSKTYLEKHKEKVREWTARCTEFSTAEGIIAASLAMRARNDTTQVLRQARYPVLFIIGKEDLAVLPERVLPQTHLPDCAVIELLDHVAHMGMMEAPEPCLKAVQQWLSLCDLKNQVG